MVAHRGESIVQVRCAAFESACNSRYPVSCRLLQPRLQHRKPVECKILHHARHCCACGCYEHPITAHPGRSGQGGMRWGASAVSDVLRRARQLWGSASQQAEVGDGCFLSNDFVVESFVVCRQIGLCSESVHQWWTVQVSDIGGGRHRKAFAGEQLGPVRVFLDCR